MMAYLHAWVEKPTAYDLCLTITTLNKPNIQRNVNTIEKTNQRQTNKKQETVYLST